MLAYNKHICYLTGYSYAVSLVPLLAIMMAVLLGYKIACMLQLSISPLTYINHHTVLSKMSRLVNETRTF